MKKKQFYENPSMRVFELRQKPALLVGSNGGLDPLSPFNPGTDPLNS